MRPLKQHLPFEMDHLSLLRGAQSSHERLEDVGQRSSAKSTPNLTCGSGRELEAVLSDVGTIEGGANWSRASSAGPVTHRGLPVRTLGAEPFDLFDELFHLCLDVGTHPDVRGAVASA